MHKHNPVASYLSTNNLTLESTSETLRCALTEQVREEKRNDLPKITLVIDAEAGLRPLTITSAI